MSHPVTNVTLMSDPLFETTHNFQTGPVERLLSFSCFNHGVFRVFIRKETSSILGSYLTVTVLQEGCNPEYRVNIEVTDSHNRLHNRTTATAVVNNHHPASKPLFRDRQLLDGFVTIRMEFEVETGDKRKTPNTLADDLKPFLDEGSKVTLVGSNGQITVSKFLLKLRSPALKAMFSHNVQENESSTIDLKDFDTNVLQAFCDYLLTDVMEEDNLTAIGLYILADKYVISGLKQQAENFILENIEDFNHDEVFEVMIKIGQPRLKRMFKDRYPE